MNKLADEIQALLDLAVQRGAFNLAQAAVAVRAVEQVRQVVAEAMNAQAESEPGNEPTQDS
jgi:hypothetical protein